MKGKIENEIINYSVSRGEQQFANEMKGNGTIWELSHYLTASDEIVDLEGITVYSIPLLRCTFLFRLTLNNSS